MTISLAYIFYVVPRNFNLRLRNRAMMNDNFGIKLDMDDNENNTRRSSGGKSSMNENNIDIVKYNGSELDLINELKMNEQAA